MQSIRKPELQEAMKDKQKILLINVLPEEYFKQKTIPGSISIPFKDNAEFVQQVKEKMTSEDQKVVVFCAGMQCDMSRQAARQLTEAGLQNVQAYEEGVEGWFGKAEDKAA